MTISQLLDYLSKITITTLIAVWGYLGWKGEWVWKREVQQRDLALTQLMDAHQRELARAKDDCCEWKELGRRMLTYADEAVKESRAAVQAVTRK